MIATSFAANALAVAVKVPVVDPAGTVTEAGMVRFRELGISVTVPPVEPLSVMVQVVFALDARVVAAQRSEEIVVREARLIVVV